MWRSIRLMRHIFGVNLGFFMWRSIRLMRHIFGVNLGFFMWRSIRYKGRNKIYQIKNKSATDIKTHMHTTFLNYFNILKKKIENSFYFRFFFVFFDDFESYLNKINLAFIFIN